MAVVNSGRWGVDGYGGCELREMGWRWCMAVLNSGR